MLKGSSLARQGRAGAGARQVCQAWGAVLWGSLPGKGFCPPALWVLSTPKGANPFGARQVWGHGQHRVRHGKLTGAGGKVKDHPCDGATWAVGGMSRPLSLGTSLLTPPASDNWCWVCSSQAVVSRDRGQKADPA